MNEFTKEELLDINGWLSEIHHDSFDDVGCMITKIKSMIDNYCEHEEKDDIDKMIAENLQDEFQC